MKCLVVQRRLLSIEDPAQVPADVRAHLAGCALCRDWHRQLLLLERHVPSLPVPRSRGKARLLHRLLLEPAQPEQASKPAAAPPAAAPAAASPAAAARSGLRAPGFRRAAAALTAAVLTLALGWGFWPHRSAPPPARPAADPLLASLVRRDVRLAQAGTVRERLEILADLADDLRGETQVVAQAASGEDLAELAKLYEQVVRDGILRQAQALAAADRPRLLGPLAKRLAGAERAVGQLARRVPPEYAPPLRVIGAAAREGSLRLLALQEERS